MGFSSVVLPGFDANREADFVPKYFHFYLYDLIVFLFIGRQMLALTECEIRTNAQWQCNQANRYSDHARPGYQSLI